MEKKENNLYWRALRDVAKKINAIHAATIAESSPLIVDATVQHLSDFKELNEMLHPVSLLKTGGNRTFVFLTGHQLFSQPYPKGLVGDIIYGQQNCNFCLVKDFTCSWFSNGLLGCNENILEVGPWITNFLNTHSLNADYVGGFSSGAYSAIVVGTQIGAKKVFAFGAQTRIDKGTVSFFSKSNPWTDAALFEANTFSIPVDLVDFLSEHRNLPEIHLVVGAECDTDLQAAERLSVFDSVHIHKIDGCFDHQVLFYMRKNGLLKDFFNLHIS